VLGLFDDWAPQYLIDLIASFSLLTHLAAISRGVLDITAIFFFGALTMLFLYLNQQLVEIRKAS